MYHLKIEKQMTIEVLGLALESLLRNTPAEGENHPFGFRELC